MDVLMWIILYVAAWMVLAYHRASLTVWTIAFGVLLLIQTVLAHVGGGIASWVIFAVIALALNCKPLRKVWFSAPILSLFRKIMPKMSKTEAEALTAGTVGWEGDCFSGMPDWDRLQSLPAPRLTDEEQAFIDGPVEALCAMLDDWEITHKLSALPEPVWAHIKAHGFLGMIIKKQYGGKEFSALAHSAVITKLAAVSVSVATTVSVPNSLGPGELIQHYGTDHQKEYYLPRLAKGQEIPCFALTSPLAGSDAAAMQDTGIVCKREFEGKETLGVLLNWDKRYITLSPIATILGLAFKCYDPEHLLGQEEDLGITCALIPTQTDGVVTGRRHFPLNSAFSNGPTQGHDVFIPMDWIIGGQPMVGHGWRMLMECLAAGRGISLPSMVMGGSRAGALAAGVYARSRRQFNTAISNFEGVEEAMARIVGKTYMIEAARLLTLTMLDMGEKPAVGSAIGKYHITETARSIIIDLMDVHGGKGICLGPNNYLGRAYQEAPVSITVEGANILTRSMIIFGQGAIRCHPFMLDLMQSAGDKDLNRFDKALSGHMGYLISNWTRSIVLSVTNGCFAAAPKGMLKPYYKKLTRYSAAFSHVTDICMTMLGGELKRKEKMSARLGDCLSLLYMGSAVLKHFENGGSKKDELPAVAWAMQDIFYRLQVALDGILRNFPNRIVAAYMRAWVFPLGLKEAVPSDKAGHQLVKKIIAPSDLRDRFAADLYMTPNDNNLVGKMCAHLQDFIDVESLESKMHKAIRKGEVKGNTYELWVQSALDNNVLTENEAQRMLTVNALRLTVNAVDDFDASELALGQVLQQDLSGVAEQA
jgi:acyl-CoA dehydrogenase